MPWDVSIARCGLNLDVDPGGCQQAAYGGLDLATRYQQHLNSEGSFTLFDREKWKIRQHPANHPVLFILCPECGSLRAIDTGEAIGCFDCERWMDGKDSWPMSKSFVNQTNGVHANTSDNNNAHFSNGNTTATTTTTCRTIYFDLHDPGP